MAMESDTTGYFRGFPATPEGMAEAQRWGRKLDAYARPEHALVADSQVALRAAADALSGPTAGYAAAAAWQDAEKTRPLPRGTRISGSDLTRVGRAALRAYDGTHNAAYLAARAVADEIVIAHGGGEPTDSVGS